MALINEGGNIFGDKTRPIKKEDIEPTVAEYFKQLAKVFPGKKAIFNKEHFQYVGSVGKKDQSGDIDFAVDVKSLVSADFSKESVEAWGISYDDVLAQFNVFKKRARTSTDNSLMIKSLLTLIARKINESTSDIHCEESKTTTGNLFGLFPQFVGGEKQDYGVQMDWMVGNLNWLKFSYHSEVYKGNVKGLHRTQLLLSIFDYYGYRFDHVNGLKNKETGEVVATTPEGAIAKLSELVGKHISDDQVNNYFKLIEIVNGLPKNDREGILEIYFKILDRTRADIPEDLQSDWIRMKDRLGLTGKFLPQTSNLNQYIKEQIISILKKAIQG